MTEPFEPGQTVAGYRLEKRLGGGGFGEVWRARSTQGGEPVALKLLKTDKATMRDSVHLRAEVEMLAAAASKLSPNVVRVLGAGVDVAPYVVMELIDGVSLEAEIEERGAISQAETLRILRAVAGALGTLEQAGIIHRDIKPANVMIARDGTIKLTDFGIAKIVGFDSVTATGQLPLSAAYAAPEVWAGQATHQSDIYALGVMAFQCLTGQRPFGGTFVQLFEAHRNQPPQLGLLPGDTVQALRRLVSACMEKEPSRRPAGSAAVLAIVAEAEAELRQSAAAPTPEEPTHEPTAIGPWLILVLHPRQQWAFLCTHETSGERATVEVHFGDTLALGEELRKAVAANPGLVPLGAERLLGTNRLLLRPGEAWRDPPPGRFTFWVAREELPDPPAFGALTAEMLARARASAQALEDAADAAGLAIDFSLDGARLLRDGSIHVRRAGLPAKERCAAASWLETSARVRPEPAPPPVPPPHHTPPVAPAIALGVARNGPPSRGDIEGSGTQTVVLPQPSERTTLSAQPVSLPPLAQPTRDRAESDEPPVQFALDETSTTGSPRRGHLELGLLATVLVIAVVGGAYGAFALANGTSNAGPSGTPTPIVAVGTDCSNGACALVALDYEFLPTTLTAVAGTEVVVTFENRGEGPHRVRFVQPGRVDFDQPAVGEILNPPGTTLVKFTARSPGTYSFSCDFHPLLMTGTLIVKEPPPLPSTTATAGKTSTETASVAATNAPTRIQLVANWDEYQSPALRDSRVRAALSMSLPDFGLKFIPGDVADRDAYNPTTARALLAAAGYRGPGCEKCSQLQVTVRAGPKQVKMVLRMETSWESHLGMLVTVIEDGQMLGDSFVLSVVPR